MSTIDIWPGLGLTVADENGDTIPIGGISVVWSEFYENLVRKGLVKTYDPTGLDGSPLAVTGLTYDDLGIAYDPNNYTETAATIAGHLEGIDTVIDLNDSPTGYTPASATVKGHLDGVGTTLAAKAALDHDATHVRAGSDEIDGDLLDVDYSSTTYTKTVAPTSSHVDHLASHLYGIDLQLAATEFNIATETGTTYTLTSDDFDGRTFILFTNASGCTVTLPSSLGVTSGRAVVLYQAGAAQVTVSPDETSVNYTDTLLTRAQYSAIVLVALSGDTYMLLGDTESA